MRPLQQLACPGSSPRGLATWRRSGSTRRAHYYDRRAERRRVGSASHAVDFGDWVGKGRQGAYRGGIPGKFLNGWGAPGVAGWKLGVPLPHRLQVDTPRRRPCVGALDGRQHLWDDLSAAPAAGLESPCQKFFRSRHRPHRRRHSFSHEFLTNSTRDGLAQGASVLSSSLAHLLRPLISFHRDSVTGTTMMTAVCHTLVTCRLERPHWLRASPATASCCADDAATASGASKPCIPSARASPQCTGVLGVLCGSARGAQAAPAVHSCCVR